ncbi:major facilitator superfamily domain-containing protein [Nemania sp. FL0916]|nr:major facilitator superfamily domain-containing protein [Nemania sp. FL0916]
MEEKDENLVYVDQGGSSTIHSSNASNDQDANVMDFDNDDPEHPYNWPVWRTRLNLVLISCMTFLTPLASSIFAPGVPQLVTEFHSSNLAIASFVVSVYVLGFAAGPLVLAPLSELYGRLPIYHISNVGFIAFTVACALAPSLGSLIAFRLLAGIFGSCPITVGAGSINDLVPQEKRATAIAFFAIGPLLGPVVGPVAGGFLAGAKGWRWTFWLLVIAGGALSLVAFAFMSESYHPIILRRKVAKIRAQTGNNDLRSKYDLNLTSGELFKRNIIRPLKMLAYSPIMMIMSLYIAVTYGYLYLMFTTITQVFQETYNFSTSLVGLAFLGLGIGSLLGIVVYTVISTAYAKKHHDANSKTAIKPEFRLITLPLGAILLPAGLFLYGWTAEYKVHWIVPIIGMGITGIGTIIIFMGILAYLIDAFTIYSASAIAANAVVRSIASAVLPLAGLPMYARLGVGWGNSVLGFIAVALIPVAFLIIKYGERLRNKFEIKNL